LIINSKIERWRAWQAATPNRRIFSAILILVVMTGVVKLAATCRELIVAGYFGVSEAVDAFLIAFLLPMFAINVLAGSFSAALMPTYIRTRDSKGLIAAQQLFSSAMALGILFLVAAAIVLAVIAPTILPILGSGFSANTMGLTQNLFYWLLPVLVFTGISQLYSTAMNAGERFALVALAPTVTPICAVIFLVLLVDRWNIQALAIGTLFGSVVEILILAYVATRRGISFCPRWGGGITEELRVVIGQYMPMVAGAFLMSGTVLVDQAMAAMLESGSVATLNFANRVVALVLGVGSMALGTAVLPHFSRMVADNDWSGVHHTFKTYALLITFLSIPITAILFLFSESIISVLFERGAFEAEDTRLVGQVQAYYVLQIPFYILGILTVRLISSLRSNHILMWGAGISLSLNIILNFVFMRWLGVSGIALSTACVYAVSFLFLIFMLAKRLREVRVK
jgi:putative peptidoglycan lipid II flippase